MSEAATTYYDYMKQRGETDGVWAMSGLGQSSLLHVDGEDNMTEDRGLGTQAIPGHSGPEHALRLGPVWVGSSPKSP